jgi:DNA-binding beta-propeller fold protein YncE
VANTVIGDYELLKELGRGGMGVVHLAQDHRLNRRVAVKELLMAGQVMDDDKETIVARFKREAQAAAKLQHANIVAVYDYLQHGNSHYMVMELLEGNSLQHYIDGRQTFSVEQTIDIGNQVCAALDYAHAHKIVHRDIKPDNVFMLENGSIKLMDFGVARHVGEVSKLTQAGTTLGTIAYISPEQLCDSRLVDGRSDLFSLGAMLYEMLTLRTPFDSGSVGATIMKIMGEEPVPPRQMNPAIPAKLEAVIMRALRKNPDERFPRASDMGQALSNAIRSDAATAPRNVQLNVVTCRECGAGIPGGQGPCPKCGRLKAAADGGAGQRMTGPLARPGAPGVGSGGLPRHTGPLGPAVADDMRQTRSGSGPLGRLTGHGSPARPTPSGRLRDRDSGFLNRPVVGARFLKFIGTVGFAPGSFQQPRGLGLDAARNLYVADTENGRVQVFAPNGTLIREIKPASGRDSFRFPRAVAITPGNDQIFIIDELDYRVFIFGMDGRQTQIWDRRRKATDASVIAGRMVINAAGQIFVSEPNAHRVCVYSKSLAYMGSFSADGGMGSPSGLALMPDRGLAVLDYAQCKVHLLDESGRIKASYGRRGGGAGEFSVPRDMCVDPGGTVYVADTLNHRIQVLGPNGQPTAVFSQKGKQDGEVAGPEGIVWAPDDLLYVSDRGNSRVQVFQLERAR